MRGHTPTMIIERARYHADEGLRLYRMADNWLDKMNMVRFIFLLNFHRLARQLPVAKAHYHYDEFHHSDAIIEIFGAKHVVGLGTLETNTLQEVYRDLIYDQMAEFTPKAGWVVFDIGANVGVFAIRQAMQGARVYAFEPNHECYRRLSKAIAINGLAGRVKAFNEAVGAAPGLGAVFVPQGFTTSGSVVPIVGETSVRAPSVSIAALDHIVPSLSVTHIDLLKIDVEGGEFQVLLGSEQTLKIVERIIVEYYSEDLRKQVESLLHGSGFSQVLQLDNDSSDGVGLLYMSRSSQTNTGVE